MNFPLDHSAAVRSLPLDDRAEPSNVTTLLQLGASYQRGFRPLVAGPFSIPAKRAAHSQAREERSNDRTRASWEKSRLLDALIVRSSVISRRSKGAASLVARIRSQGAYSDTPFTHATRSGLSGVDAIGGSETSNLIHCNCSCFQDNCIRFLTHQTE